MKSPEDSIWTRKTHQTDLDFAENLAYGPSGGPVKQWVAGVILASIPAVYGIYCIQRGYTTLFGRGGSSEKLVGPAGLWLAVAYISLGAVLHFHYFWGLADRLWRFSLPLKVVSLLVFLSALIYSLALAFA